MDHFKVTVCVVDASVGLTSMDMPSQESSQYDTAFLALNMGGSGLRPTSRSIPNLDPAAFTMASASARALAVALDSASILMDSGSLLL